MNSLGFLSFGHWQDVPGSLTRTAKEAYTQTVELTKAAESLGLQGAYLRVHHYARQLSSPFPLLAAMATATSRIEVGTAVIDMRYENPLGMAELAAATDLLSNNRLQLGISRGSPEPALNGPESFGYTPQQGEDYAALARRHLDLFRQAISGEPVVDADPKMVGIPTRLRIEPRSPSLPSRIWWGAGTRATALWTAQQGLNLMSSTLLLEDTGVPFDALQSEQIDTFLEEWARNKHTHSPRISVSRSIFPITSPDDEHYFGHSNYGDKLGILDSSLSRFGRVYAGSPEYLAEELSKDSAIQKADTLLVTIPNQLGVEYNTHLLSNIAEVFKLLGWHPAIRD